MVSQELAFLLDSIRNALRIKQKFMLNQGLIGSLEIELLLALPHLLMIEAKTTL